MVRDYLTGGPMPPSITTELAARGTSTPNSKWRVEKKSWMQISSNSNQGEMKIGGFEKRKVADFYETQNPMVVQPVMNGISVNSTGTGGSMRKATVTFTLYSLEQLKKAQLSYFVPGLTALVQWGWSIDSGGNATGRLSTPLKGSFVSAQETVFSHIGKNPSMDAMLGLISTFNWSFDPSSKSYNCELTLDSPGKAYISGPVDISNKSDNGCTSKDAVDKGDGTGTWMKVALKDIAERNMVTNVPWMPGGIHCGGTLRLAEDSKEEASVFSKLASFFGSPTINHYVTWAWWESAIVSGLSPVSPQYGENSSNTLLGDTQQKKWSSKHVWRLDSSGSRMKCPKLLPYASSDPWIALIPGRFHWQAGNATTPGGIKESAGLPNAMGTFGSGYLLLGKVLLNTYFLWNTFLDCKTIDEYVLKVANKVNDVCGGFWNIELVDDPMDASTMRIIDSNYAPAKTGAPKITVYGTDSCARSWGISTDIPPALRNSVMMGSQKNKGGKANNNNQPSNAYLSYAKTVSDNLMGEQKLKTVREPGEECANGQPKSHNQDPGSLKAAAKDALANLAENRDDETVDEAKGAMKALYSADNAPADNGGCIIPIGFQGTFDGIGGMNWGQLFTIPQASTLLPPDYAFQVTSVKHTVSQGDWTTSIESALRLKGK